MSTEANSQDKKISSISFFLYPILLAPLPIVSIFLPPLFIFHYSLSDYLAAHSNSILLFTLWFAVEAISRLLFLTRKRLEDENNKTVQRSPREFRYLTSMLLTSFALVVVATTGEYLPKKEVQWFCLGLLSLLPLIALAGKVKSQLFPLLVTLGSFTAFGFTRFGTAINPLDSTRLYLAIAFSLGFASLLAHLPSLRLIHAGDALPRSKFYLRLLTALWALFPAVCISVVGFGLLPNAFVVTVLGFVFIQRLAEKLKKYEETGELSPFYWRTGVVTLWLETALLIGSAELSSYLARANLA